MRKKIAILGGDIRETVVANTLIKSGYKIKVFGLPKDHLTDPAVEREEISEALYGADAVILPVKGVDEEGYLYSPWLEKKGEKVKITKEMLVDLSSNAVIYVGVASKYLQAMAVSASLVVVPVMELDPIAVPNAVPTAEGALSVAIEHSPYTVKGSRTLILGFGRVGKATAALFRSVGSKVSLCSRNEQEIREALANGYDMRRYSGLTRVLPRSDIIINTVPALVLTGEYLSHVGKNAIIIDLASKPGGVDFKAAADLGIPAYHSLGLPGKCAPITAGEILAEGIMALLEGEGE
ncbi:MAG: dipicolinate synthase subunit DpsA [Bacillota bacterium]|nr:dipicolinate synthase subunit DpsA [Bacillota bacterium]